MEIKLIESQQEYLKGLDGKESFLQSYEYGQMQKELGYAPYYFGFYKDGKNYLSVLAILFRAKRGAYFLVPYAKFEKDELKILVEKLKEISKKEKVDFLRFSQIMAENEENRKMFSELGFKNAPVHMMHPELLWLLDIKKDDEKILCLLNVRTAVFVWIRHRCKEKTPL